MNQIRSWALLSYMNSLAPACCFAHFQLMTIEESMGKKLPMHMRTRAARSVRSPWLPLSLYLVTVCTLSLALSLFLPLSLVTACSLSLCLTLFFSLHPLIFLSRFLSFFIPVRLLAVLKHSKRTKCGSPIELKKSLVREGRTGREKGRGANRSWIVNGTSPQAAKQSIVRRDVSSSAESHKNRLFLFLLQQESNNWHCVLSNLRLFSVWV